MYGPLEYIEIDFIVIFKKYLLDYYRNYYLKKENTNLPIYKPFFEIIKNYEKSKKEYDNNDNEKIFIKF